MRLVLTALLFAMLFSCAKSPRGASPVRETFPERYIKDSDASTSEADEESLPDSILGSDGEATPDEKPAREKPATAETTESLPDSTEKKPTLADSIWSTPSPTGSPDKGYRIYANSRFNYQLFIPSSWYITEQVVSNVAQTIVTRNSSEMSVETYKPARSKVDYYRSRAIRKMVKIDPRYKTIISGEEIRLHTGVYGTLMVHEYRKKRVRYLRRSLVFIQEGNAYIVWCEAPVSRFYADETAFNTFMTSFRRVED
ncbi:MAG: hypothetical protein PF637_14160 [Spirochaetes bacterium]|jgi:hypothetical protein|nr:hypothetical protein [Spirochaetota bacterium]